MSSQQSKKAFYLKQKSLVAGLSAIVVLLVLTTSINFYYSQKANHQISYVVLQNKTKHKYLDQIQDGIRKRQIIFREIIMKRDDIFVQDELWREADIYASDVLVAINKFKKSDLTENEKLLFSEITTVMKEGYNKQNLLAEKILFEEIMSDITAELSDLLKVQNKVFYFMQKMESILDVENSGALQNIENQSKKNIILISGLSGITIFAVFFLSLVVIKKQKSQDVLIDNYIGDINELNRSLEARVKERTNELLLAKEEAEKLSRVKSEFLSNMSHELRTPLNAIYGSAQLLETLTKDFNEDDKSWVQNIIGSSKHLMHLVNDVLDISKITTGKLAVDPVNLNVYELLEQSLDAVSPMLVDKKITLVKDIRTESYALADPLRLKQVFINLLSNAIKYNDIGGTIEINYIAKEDNFIRVSIKDSGEGIRKDDVPRVFDMFERLGKEGSTELGSGVGLALCMKLMELMNGDIGVQSIVGEGSTFWIDIPKEKYAA